MKKRANQVSLTGTAGNTAGTRYERGGESKPRNLKQPIVVEKKSKRYRHLLKASLAVFLFSLSIFQERLKVDYSLRKLF